MPRGVSQEAALATSLAIADDFQCRSLCHFRLKHGEGDHQVSVPNVSRISGSMKKLSLIDDMERNIARNAAPQVGLSDPSMQVCARG